MIYPSLLVLADAARRARYSESPRIREERVLRGVSGSRCKPSDLIRIMPKVYRISEVSGVGLPRDCEDINEED
jgi:hypothetical protein